MWTEESQVLSIIVNALSQLNGSSSKWEDVKAELNSKLVGFASLQTLVEDAIVDFDSEKITAVSYAQFTNMRIWGHSLDNIMVRESAQVGLSDLFTNVEISKDYNLTYDQNILPYSTTLSLVSPTGKVTSKDVIMSLLTSYSEYSKSLLNISENTFANNSVTAVLVSPATAGYTNIMAETPVDTNIRVNVDQSSFIQASDKFGVASAEILVGSRIINTNRALTFDISVEEKILREVLVADLDFGNIFDQAAPPLMAPLPVLTPSAKAQASIATAITGGDLSTGDTIHFDSVKYISITDDTSGQNIHAMVTMSLGNKVRMISVVLPYEYSRNELELKTVAATLDESNVISTYREYPSETLSSSMFNVPNGISVTSAVYKAEPANADETATIVLTLEKSQASITKEIHVTYTHSRDWNTVNNVVESLDFIIDKSDRDNITATYPLDTAVVVDNTIVDSTKNADEDDQLKVIYTFDVTKGIESTTKDLEIQFAITRNQSILDSILDTMTTVDQTYLSTTSVPQAFDLSKLTLDPTISKVGDIAIVIKDYTIANNDTKEVVVKFGLTLGTATRTITKTVQFYRTINEEIVATTTANNISFMDKSLREHNIEANEMASPTFVTLDNGVSITKVTLMPELDANGIVNLDSTHGTIELETILGSATGTVTSPIEFDESFNDWVLSQVIDSNLTLAQTVIDHPQLDKTLDVADITIDSTVFKQAGITVTSATLDVSNDSVDAKLLVSIEKGTSTKDFVIPLTLSKSIAQEVIDNLTDQSFSSSNEEYVPATSSNLLFSITDPIIANLVNIDVQYVKAPGSDQLDHEFDIEVSYLSASNVIRVSHSFPKSINQKLLDSYTIDDFAIDPTIMATLAPGTILTSNMSTKPPSTNIDKLGYVNVDADRQAADMTMEVSIGLATKTFTWNQKFNVKAEKLALSLVSAKDITKIMALATTDEHEIANIGMQASDFEIAQWILDIGLVEIKLVSPVDASTFNNDDHTVPYDIQLVIFDGLPNEETRTIAKSVLFNKSVNENILDNIDETNVTLTNTIDNGPTQTISMGDLEGLFNHAGVQETVDGIRGVLIDPATGLDLSLNRFDKNADHATYKFFVTLGAATKEFTADIQFPMSINQEILNSLIQADFVIPSSITNMNAPLDGIMDSAFNPEVSITNSKSIGTQVTSITSKVNSHDDTDSELTLHLELGTASRDVVVDSTFLNSYNFDLLGSMNGGDVTVGQIILDQYPKANWDKSISEFTISPTLANGRDTTGATISSITKVTGDEDDNKSFYEISVIIGQEKTVLRKEITFAMSENEFILENLSDSDFDIETNASGVPHVLNTSSIISLHTGVVVNAVSVNGAIDKDATTIPMILSTGLGKATKSDNAINFTFANSINQNTLNNITSADLNVPQSIIDAGVTLDSTTMKGLTFSNPDVVISSITVDQTTNADVYNANISFDLEMGTATRTISIPVNFAKTINEQILANIDESNISLSHSLTASYPQTSQEIVIGQAIDNDMSLISTQNADVTGVSILFVTNPIFTPSSKTVVYDIEIAIGTSRKTIQKTVTFNNEYALKLLEGITATHIVRDPSISGPEKGVMPFTFDADPFLFEKDVSVTGGANANISAIEVVQGTFSTASKDVTLELTIDLEHESVKIQKVLEFETEIDAGIFDAISSNDITHILADSVTGIIPGHAPALPVLANFELPNQIQGVDVQGYAITDVRWAMGPIDEANKSGDVVLKLEETSTGKSREIVMRLNWASSAELDIFNALSDSDVVIDAQYLIDNYAPTSALFDTTMVKFGTSPLSNLVVNISYPNGFDADSASVDITFEVSVSGSTPKIFHETGVTFVKGSYNQGIVDTVNKGLITPQAGLLTKDAPTTLSPSDFMTLPEGVTVSNVSNYVMPSDPTKDATADVEVSLGTATATYTGIPFSFNITHADAEYTNLTAADVMIGTLTSSHPYSDADNSDIYDITGTEKDLFALPASVTGATITSVTMLPALESDTDVVFVLKLTKSINGVDRELTLNVDYSFAESRDKYFLSQLTDTNLIVDPMMLLVAQVDNLTLNTTLSGSEVTPNMSITDIVPVLSAPNEDQKTVDYTATIHLGSADRDIAISVPFTKSLNDVILENFNISTSSNYTSGSFVPGQDELDITNFTVTGGANFKTILDTLNNNIQNATHTTTNTVNTANVPADSNNILVEYDATSFDATMLNPTVNVTIRLGDSTKVIPVQLGFAKSYVENILDKLPALNSIVPGSSIDLTIYPAATMTATNFDATFTRNWDQSIKDSIIATPNIDISDLEVTDVQYSVPSSGNIANNVITELTFTHANSTPSVYSKTVNIEFADVIQQKLINDVTGSMISVRQNLVDLYPLALFDSSDTDRVELDYSLVDPQVAISNVQIFKPGTTDVYDNLSDVVDIVVTISTDNPLDPAKPITGEFTLASIQFADSTTSAILKEAQKVVALLPTTTDASLPATGSTISELTYIEDEYNNIKLPHDANVTYALDSSSISALKTPHDSTDITKVNPNLSVIDVVMELSINGQTVTQDASITYPKSINENLADIITVDDLQFLDKELWQKADEVLRTSDAEKLALAQQIGIIDNKGIEIIGWATADPTTFDPSTATTQDVYWELLNVVDDAIDSNLIHFDAVLHIGEVSKTFLDVQRQIGRGFDLTQSDVLISDLIVNTLNKTPISIEDNIATFANDISLNSTLSTSMYSVQVKDITVVTPNVTKYDETIDLSITFVDSNGYVSAPVTYTFDYKTITGFTSAAKEAIEAVRNGITSTFIDYSGTADQTQITDSIANSLMTSETDYLINQDWMNNLDKVQLVTAGSADPTKDPSRNGKFVNVYFEIAYDDNNGYAETITLPLQIAFENWGSHDEAILNFGNGLTTVQLGLDVTWSPKIEDPNAPGTFLPAVAGNDFDIQNKDQTTFDNVVKERFEKWVEETFITNLDSLVSNNSPVMTATELRGIIENKVDDTYIASLVTELSADPTLTILNLMTTKTFEIRDEVIKDKLIAEITTDWFTTLASLKASQVFIDIETTIDSVLSKINTWDSWTSADYDITKMDTIKALFYANTLETFKNVWIADSTNALHASALAIYEQNIEKVFASDFETSYNAEISKLGGSFTNINKFIAAIEYELSTHHIENMLNLSTYDSLGFVSTPTENSTEITSLTPDETTSLFALNGITILEMYFDGARKTDPTILESEKDLTSIPVKARIVFGSAKRTVDLNLNLTSSINQAILDAILPANLILKDSANYTDVADMLAKLGTTEPDSAQFEVIANFVDPTETMVIETVPSTYAHDPVAAAYNFDIQLKITKGTATRTIANTFTAAINEFNFNDDAYSPANYAYESFIKLTNTQTSPYQFENDSNIVYKDELTFLASVGATLQSGGPNLTVDDIKVVNPADMYSTTTELQIMFRDSNGVIAPAPVIVTLNNFDNYEKEIIFNKVANVETTYNYTGSLDELTLNVLNNEIGDENNWAITSNPELAEMDKISITKITKQDSSLIVEVEITYSYANSNDLLQNNTATVTKTLTFARMGTVQRSIDELGLAFTEAELLAEKTNVWTADMTNGVEYQESINTITENKAKVLLLEEFEGMFANFLSMNVVDQTLIDNSVQFEMTTQFISDLQAAIIADPTNGVAIKHQMLLDVFQPIVLEASRIYVNQEVADRVHATDITDVATEFAALPAFIEAEFTNAFNNAVDWTTAFNENNIIAFIDNVVVSPFFDQLILDEISSNGNSKKGDSQYHFFEDIVSNGVDGGDNGITMFNTELAKATTVQALSTAIDSIVETLTNQQLDLAEANNPTTIDVSAEAGIYEEDIYKLAKYVDNSNFDFEKYGVSIGKYTDVVRGDTIIDSTEYWLDDVDLTTQISFAGIQRDITGALHLDNSVLQEFINEMHTPLFSPAIEVIGINTMTSVQELLDASLTGTTPDQDQFRFTMETNNAKLTVPVLTTFAIVPGTFHKVSDEEFTIEYTITVDDQNGHVITDTFSSSMILAKDIDFTDPSTYTRFHLDNAISYTGTAIVPIEISKDTTLTSQIALTSASAKRLGATIVDVKATTTPSSSDKEITIAVTMEDSFGNQKVFTHVINGMKSQDELLDAAAAILEFNGTPVTPGDVHTSSTNMTDVTIGPIGTTHPEIDQIGVSISNVTSIAPTDSAKEIDLTVTLRDKFGATKVTTLTIDNLKSADELLAELLRDAINLVATTTVEGGIAPSQQQLEDVEKSDSFKELANDVTHSNAQQLISDRLPQLMLEAMLNDENKADATTKTEAWKMPFVSLVSSNNGFESFENYVWDNLIDDVNGDRLFDVGDKGIGYDTVITSPSDIDSAMNAFTTTPSVIEGPTMETVGTNNDAVVRHTQTAVTNTDSKTGIGFDQSTSIDFVDSILRFDYAIGSTGPVGVTYSSTKTNSIDTITDVWLSENYTLDNLTVKLITTENEIIYISLVTSPSGDKTVTRERIFADGRMLKTRTRLTNGLLRTTAGHAVPNGISRLNVDLHPVFEGISYSAATTANVSTKPSMSAMPSTMASSALQQRIALLGASAYDEMDGPYLTNPADIWSFDTDAADAFTPINPEYMPGGVYYDQFMLDGGTGVVQSIVTSNNTASANGLSNNVTSVIYNDIDKKPVTLVATTVPAAKAEVKVSTIETFPANFKQNPNFDQGVFDKMGTAELAYIGVIDAATTIAEVVAATDPAATPEAKAYFDSLDAFNKSMLAKVNSTIVTQNGINGLAITVTNPDVTSMGELWILLGSIGAGLALIGGGLLALFKRKKKLKGIKK